MSGDKEAVDTDKQKYPSAFTCRGFRATSDTSAYSQELRTVRAIRTRSHSRVLRTPSLLHLMSALNIVTLLRQAHTDTQKEGAGNYGPPSPPSPFSPFSKQERMRQLSLKHRALSSNGLLWPEHTRTQRHKYLFRSVAGS